MSGKPHTSRFHRHPWSCWHPASASMRYGSPVLGDALVWMLCCLCQLEPQPLCSPCLSQRLCALPARASSIQALPTNLLQCSGCWFSVGKGVCPRHVLAKTICYIRPQHHYSGITFAICFTKLILDTIIRGNHPHNTLSTHGLKWSNFRPLEKWIHRTCLWMARKGHFK